ncbi:MAG: class I SAM-dependent methyltransferase [Ginsengibacter sp.]
MYSTFRLAKKYLHYYLTAANGKGHGIHSPFVYDFVSKVMRDKKEDSCYPAIEKERTQLINDGRTIEVQDFGAGSSMKTEKKRVVKDIARSSLKNKKFARLLFRIVTYYQSQNIIELGTSLGITTSYLAKANPSAKVYTLEGSPNIAGIAAGNFRNLGISNIELITGKFENTLPPLLQKIPVVDLAFIDGNHQKEPTLLYFKWLSAKINPSSILIFDDIHWSKEMEEAWAFIREDALVTLSIDLFFMGIVFFSDDFKAKQHFTIRF